MSNPSPGGNYQMRPGMMSGMPSHMGQDGLPNQHVPNQMVSGQQGFMHEVSPNFDSSVHPPGGGPGSGSGNPDAAAAAARAALVAAWLLLLQRPLLPQPLLT